MIISVPCTRKFKFGGEIVLWCNSRCQKVDARICRKRDSDTGLLKYQEKEDELESIFKADIMTNTQLRLWARMISSSIHSDMDNPQMFLRFVAIQKKPRKETVIEAIADAAVTMKAFSVNDTPGTSGARHSIIAGISPGKTVDLCMKNFEQLRYLQNHFDDGILNEKEFAKQKTTTMFCPLYVNCKSVLYLYH